MSDEVMQDNMQHTMQDNKNPWNADLTDPMLRLRLASERLSIVRYVFLVQVEDGIASADERASLEYARRGVDRLARNRRFGRHHSRCRPA